jgi:plasmid stabilization system protein ParE
MKIRLLDSALEDIAAARTFYDSQDDGIGAYFFDSIFAEIDSLVLFAGTHLKKIGFYRQIAQRFPYAIYYKIINDDVVVFHVLDCRRNPKWIRRRLTS